MRPIPTFCRVGLAVVLIAWLSGCSAVKRSLRLPSQSADAIPGLAESSPKELDSADAAKVCAATARKLEESGDARGAILMYERARLKDPKGMQGVCRRLAVLYDRAGNYQVAQREYELALEMSPKDAELLNNLGYCHYCRGKWDLAEEMFRQAIAQDKHYERAWINLGMTLGQQEKYDESLAAFQKSVSEPEALCNLGFIYLTQGKREEAREVYVQALQLDPALDIAGFALAKIDQPENHEQDTAIASQSDMPVSSGSAIQSPLDSAVRQVQYTSNQDDLRIANPVVSAELRLP